jgi:hypothetical protein
LIIVSIGIKNRLQDDSIEASGLQHRGFRMTAWELQDYSIEASG